MATETTEARSAIDRFFKISERGSTVGREVRGGLVTFFAMAYIIVLNPLIIGTVPDSTGAFLGGGDAPDLARIAAATALVAGVVTILMGVFANFPLAIAAGLGLNAFVAFGLATQMTWADAMGLVVIEGFIMLVLVLTGFRKAVFDAVPRELKTGISVGIGLFIAFIGLVNGGFVSSTLLPAPPVQLGATGSLVGWPVVVFCIGLLAVIALYTLKVRGAILWAIIGTSIVAVIVERLVNVGPQSAEKPDRLDAQPARTAGPTRRRPRLLPARPVQPAGLVGVRRHRRGDPVCLHAAADRLLRHHGHHGRRRR
jgi:adenine/guanine/hypoxanthine permease